MEAMKHHHRLHHARPITHEAIAVGAYYLWEKSGRAPGRDVSNWLAAEWHLHLARLRELPLPPEGKR